MSNLFLKISIILLFCLTSIIIYNSSADSKFRLVDWKSHTSMFNIRSGCFDSNGSFWAATDGGLFNYNFNNSQFREYRNIGELISLDLKVVRCSPEKDDIYVGTQDGILEIFTSDKNWIHILDIKNSGFSNPGINDISFHGLRLSA